uniref:Uncharacterized protein n=1 Tax=Electrophorus electricus TaxID=8005 RepID=A0AAY5EUS9_ELEEL
PSKIQHIYLHAFMSPHFGRRLYPYVSVSVCFSISVSQYPCLSVSVCLSMSQYPCLSVSVCLSICMSQYPCLSVSVCLSICMSQYPCLSVSVPLSIRASQYPHVTQPSEHSPNHQLFDFPFVSAASLRRKERINVLTHTQLVYHYSTYNRGDNLESLYQYRTFYRLVIRVPSVCMCLLQLCPRTHSLVLTKA